MLGVCFCFLIISRLWFIPAQTGVYYYNDHFFYDLIFFCQHCLFPQNDSKKPTFRTSGISLFYMSFQVTTSSFGPLKTYELLHHMTGKGLSAKYHFPRQPCLYQPSMVAVQVILTNSSDHALEEIHIGDQSPASLNIHCFNTIGEFDFSKYSTVGHHKPSK